MQIAFWGNSRGKAGITSNIAAISTFMALEMQIRIILFENHFNLNNLENGFWKIPMMILLWNHLFIIIIWELIR